jgi:hypothetical protein
VSAIDWLLFGFPEVHWTTWLKAYVYSVLLVGILAIHVWEVPFPEVSIYHDVLRLYGWMDLEARTRRLGHFSRVDLGAKKAKTPSFAAAAAYYFSSFADIVDSFLRKCVNVDSVEHFYIRWREAEDELEQSLRLPKSLHSPEN